MAARTVDVDALVAGIRERRRAAVSQAITLVESSRAEHRLLLDDALPQQVDLIEVARAVA